MSLLTFGARRALAAGAAVAGLVLAASPPAGAQTMPVQSVAAAPATVPDSPLLSQSWDGSPVVAADQPQTQSSPNPNSSPAATPQSSTGAAPPPPGRRTEQQRAGRRFEHWEVTPTVQFTFSSGSDIVPIGGGAFNIGSPPGNTLPLDIIRIVGDARYRMNSKWALQFQRIAHTGAAGRTRPVAFSKNNPIGGTYSGHSEDYEERFLLTDTFNPFLTARAGYAIRTRECCPAAAVNPAGPRIHTGFFSDISWRFGPNTIGGKPWTTSFRWEEYKHNTKVPRPAGDEGTKPTFQFTFYSNFYVWHQTKFVPYYGIEYFSTYFSYSTTMTQTYRKVYGVAYRATPDLTWRTYVKNDQSGGILATADSAHKSTLFLEAAYRLHW